MGTARAAVVFSGRCRPTSAASLTLAEEALTRFTAGAERTSPIRFVGYDARHLPAEATPDMGCALYEADYA